MTQEQKQDKFFRTLASKRSAASLLEAGIRLRETDRAFARMSFAKAKELYAQAGQPWNAHIAEKWLERAECLDG